MEQEQYKLIIFYEGEFKNGKIDGYCVLTFDNERYNGQFKNDSMDGYGIYYYEDRDIYKGEFKNGMQERYGIFIDDFSKYEGEWSENKGIHGYEQNIIKMDINMKENLKMD